MKEQMAELDRIRKLKLNLLRLDDLSELAYKIKGNDEEDSPTNH